MRHDLEFRSIPGMVRASAGRFGEAEALADLDDGRRWSFTEVAAEMVRTARAMIALGVRPGDRVALWGPNCPEWIFTALGIQAAGGVLVPLNTRFKAEEAGYILRKSGARTVFTVTGFLGTDYLGMLPDGVRGVVMRGEVEEGVLGREEFLALGEGVEEGAVHRLIDGIGPEDVSDIMFTSGTTGSPKGVVLGHGQSLRAFGWLSGVFTFTPGDRYLIIPPFFHTFGYKAGWMACLMQGVTALPQETFDVDQVLERIAREKVSILLGPPTLFEDLMRHPRRAEYDLSSLRATVPSATTVPAELVRRLGSELGFEVVLTAYGLTESTSLVTSSRAGDDVEDIVNSVGVPADGLEVVVASPDGVALPPGEEGEVLVRGYTVMRGYWEDPEETAKAIDADGWLHTGDVGRFNERGFLSIVDRKKDMFICGGFNAYPAEIEKLLGTHPAVADVAVIGMPDERMGEVAAAFVVRSGALTEKELVAWARERIANFKVPRRVEFVDALPRNASMKVEKGKLRALLAE
ncbi:long-chain fatty acid--CoA ligase [Peterkaempfera bronchialis]|uniref:Long-chain fatty acid--CoA ligase n=2 Tax=Peterkaempfera bronchialis TaxID=2126346 RepID=A0A345T502_9ACTN|nr:long-chain fatty acid--CoA ligase [Peterkaempfera bronchialis]